jgi:hypothetical protein
MNSTKGQRRAEVSALCSAYMFTLTAPKTDTNQQPSQRKTNHSNTVKHFQKGKPNEEQYDQAFTTPDERTVPAGATYV